jgi:hypothetical protein
MIDRCTHKTRRQFCPWYYNVSGSHACASPSPTCPDFVCLNALLYERQQAAVNDRHAPQPYRPDDCPATVRA